jgi:tripartite-type tricarboxylate transporter receptor subunit TctC
MMKQILEEELKVIIKPFVYALSTILIFFALFGNAQSKNNNWPHQKPITVVVPYTPGGATDTVTRIVMEKLSQRLGQNIVIDNKPGANATIGTGQLARSDADGYHFATVIAAHSVNPHLYELPYSDSDFETVTQMAELPMFLFVSNKLPVNSVAELVDYGKKHRLNFGSSGTGSSAHMIGLHFADENNLEMTHIPYRGSAPILSDLLAGRVSLVFDPILVPMPYVKEGRLKALALSAKSKWPDEPTIPLMTELGYEDFDLSSWVALLAPKNTPKTIVEKIASEIAIILQDEEVIKKFTQAGFIPKASSPEELSKLIATDSAMYKKIIDKNQIKKQ